MDDAERTRVSPSRAGFTMVEVIIAVVILAGAILAMASTTAWVVRQVTYADATSKRSLALQTTIERLDGMDFDSLKDGTSNVGAFAVSWTVSGVGQSPVKSVVIVTTGPGLTSGGGLPIMSNNVVDSFTYDVVLN